MIHSFLLIGQSNMAGRGFKDEVEPIKNKNLFVLRNGRWRQMYVPVNADRPFSGICLAESFADLYQKEHDVQVGLIPCADGGTSLDQWQVGSLLFDHACYMAELASRTSTIAGVLWHQGESECEASRYPLYEEKFLPILDAFRDKLGLHDVPFLLGGLGDFLPNHLYQDAPNPDLPNYVHVNKALQSIAAARPRTGFVHAEGLTANPDNLHFNAKSLREFGVRYYQQFCQLEDKTKVFHEKPSEDLAIVNPFEAL